jgi:hypothetical protein
MPPPEDCSPLRSACRQRFGNASADQPTQLLITVTPQRYIDYFRDLQDLQPGPDGLLDHADIARSWLVTPSTHVHQADDKCSEEQSSSSPSPCDLRLTTSVAAGPTRWSQ